MSQPLHGARLGRLGAPRSMASLAPGQGNAPRALRDAGLLDALTSVGIEVTDHGDLPMRRWAPDRTNPRAQNVEAVVEDVAGVRDRIGRLIAAGERHLVVGGNCSIEIGVVAGYIAGGFGRLGVVCADLSPDLNTPRSNDEGSMCWLVTDR